MRDVAANQRRGDRMNRHASNPDLPYVTPSRDGTLYAAYDPELAGGIWGVGESAADALTDALEWIGGPQPSLMLERLEVLPMAPDLARLVTTQGGSVSYDVSPDRKTLTLPQE